MLRPQSVATTLAWASVAALLASPGCAAESQRPAEVEVTIAEPPRPVPGGAQKFQAVAAPRRDRAPQEPLEPCIAKLRADPVAGASADPGADLYARATAAEKRGDQDAARKLYFELIDTQSRSAFVAASYFAFAELFRAESREDPNKWPFAETAYEQVLKYPAPDNALFQVAGLRLADVRAAQGKHEQALSSYAAVNPADGGMCASATADAVQEAIVPLFAKVGNPKKAPAFFASLRGTEADRERTAQITLRLVQLYLDAKQPADAAATLRALAAQSGASTDTLCLRGQALAVRTGDASAEAAVASRCSPP